MSIVGIDLGTTNSVIAYFEGDNASVIINNEGYRTTPSIVAFNDGNILVGEQAKRQRITNINNTISSAKRKIGKNFTYQLTNGEATPEEISAEILKKLKQDAENYLGHKIVDCVITVPAYFDDVQRNATKNAGSMAGLNVLRIINEPTAAAFAYGFGKNKDEEKTILVYDLGGGTFDVSLLNVSNGLIEVIATSGINDLGGDDWDKALANYIKNQIDIKFNNIFDLSEAENQRILEISEKVKIELSTLTITNINLPYFTKYNNEIISFDDKITRETFDTLTMHLLEKTKEPILQVLSDSNISFENIDEILLIGGSTRMFAVTKFLENLSNNVKINKNINPDEAVAIGAALQGGVLDGKITETLLLDVTPLSLGIKTKGGIMHKLIDRNSTIPISRTEVFTTAYDDQSSVLVEIYQGEREFVKDNLSLGFFELNEIPLAQKGVPEIEVTFSIDVNGIVSVSALEAFSKKENKITINNTQNIAQSFIDQNINISDEKKEADKIAKEKIYIQNNYEPILKSALFYLNGEILNNNIEIKNKLSNLYHSYQENLPLSEKINILETLKKLQYEIAIILKEDNKKNT